MYTISRKQAIPAVLLLCLFPAFLFLKKASYTIKGETIALAGEAPSFLLKKDAKIQKVYLPDENGHETIFRKGIDYEEMPGGLKRTKNSSIPNFSTHHTILHPNGRFTWRPEPMNPPLSLNWQVMVDYTTSVAAAVQPGGHYMSAALKNKILSGKPLSLISIGTSITEGAHTLPKMHRNSDEAVYSRLVAKAIAKIYGNRVSLNNQAVGGSTSALLTAKLGYLLSQKPDLVFIEFGMNEHLAGSDMNGYLTAMDSAIQKLLAAGIDCALVGFFQQNPLWDLEDPASTVYYNNKLREMAERNRIFFADIYARFQALPQEKMYRDLMGDFLHHPTGYGHQLYYLSVMPAFLFKDSRESMLMEAIQ